MENQVMQKLLEELLPLLQTERLVTLSTIDFETGSPNVNAISWVYAPNEETVLFAVANKSRIVENVKKHSGVVLSFIGNETTYSVAGKATVKVDTLEGVPIKLALIEVAVEEVRDVMFYGAKISVEPKYEKIYNEKAAEKLDNQVLTAMKNA